MKKILPEALKYCKFYTPEEALNLINLVSASRKPNYAECRVDIKSGFSIPAFKLLLKEYEKETVLLNGVSFGWQ